MQKSYLLFGGGEAGEELPSKGGDGLRGTGPRQLSIVFTDSPSETVAAEPSDAADRLSLLQHKAMTNKTRAAVASVADTSGLLENVSSEFNLATALLNVVRNKGVPGGYGQTVEAAEAKGPPILVHLRRDLVAECYLPGEVRRVLLPKTRGGRELGIPYMINRTAQQADLQVLEPIFEPTFLASSHGFSPNPEAHSAIADATGCLTATNRRLIWTWPNFLTMFIINTQLPESQTA